jgi:DNA/RNA endonuclease YhcR with UshA esterase domain
MKRDALFVFAFLMLAVLPLRAHHSFAAEYDTKKPVELTGTVTSIEWVNPHAWIHMDVKDENGKVASWNFELGSPNLLLRNGWRKDTIKPGDMITVSGSAAKDGSNIANARTVKTIEGKRVFNAGSSGETGTPGAPQTAAPQQ